jgi:UDP-N-acetylglucosamine--N-acetylmuramyl-(pentapeptide) pyrophosphoryl-undecaprenol N-acetylglucosamine transferase
MIATAAKDISSTDTLTAAMKPARILMAAGGTGGHVYPAIAIADAFRQQNPEINLLFVGTRDRMEWETVPKYGYEIKSIWISGLHRRLTIQNLLFPLKLVVSIIQSIFILRSFKPELVIACGGFASGPVGWVAVKMGIPLILQEQNSFPGVTNRMLGKHASLIFTAFEEARPHFPGEKVRLTGNPVRSKLKQIIREEALKAFNFSKDKPVLLILGGSGGARAINEKMVSVLDELHNDMGLQLIWQCGESYYDGLISRISTEKYPNLRLVKFIDDMPSAYGAADLVVTRAGAGTCSELMNIGQPAVLIPSPNVAGNHQEKNARALTNAGAARLLKEENMDRDFILHISELIHDPEQLGTMSAAMRKLARPDAAYMIVKEIGTFVKQQLK